MVWRTALGSSFGEPLWGAAALESCPEQLSGTIALKNRSFRGQFYKQLRGADFSSNYWGQVLELLCRIIALGSCFREQVSRIETLGQQLWRKTLGHNFGEQRRETALGSNFGQLSRPALRQFPVTAVEFCGAFLGRGLQWQV